ncbi:alpha/beta fold hydrolase [Humibacter albus]|uniref:alpha/beta fold hydrolase n=1 Tax=Humibacter albus TaxID=427754 RepID=UPI0003B61070|nr:alpha/beta hydrolase [Humibacter albus]
MDTITVGEARLHVEQKGAGRPVVVIHGGGGAATVAPLAEHLASRARVHVPTLPGWDGAERPQSVVRVEDISDLFFEWLEQERLDDVVIVGSSIGGWIAGELAVRDRDVGRIAKAVLLDTVGFEVPGQHIRDFFALDARGVAEYSWYDSERFYVDPATLPAERTAAMASNLATMKTVAGDPYMINPALLANVASVTIPVLVAWGEADRIVTPAYGRAVAEAFPAGRFELIREAGHLPQLEQPERVHALVDAFLAE